MKRIIAYGIFLFGITLALANCTTSQQHMENSVLELDLDKGDKKTAEAPGSIKRKCVYGKATPSVLSEVLAIFKAFSREPIPTNKIDFDQQFLPELIFWVQLIYKVISQNSIGIPSDTFFAHPNIKGQFLSPYCAAIMQFQGYLDVIFESIVQQHPDCLKEGQALSATTWANCKFRSMNELIRKLDDHCKDSVHCKEWNKVLGAKNKTDHRTGEGIFRIFISTISEIKENGPEYTILWRKEAQHYIFAPIRKGISNIICQPALWGPDDKDNDIILGFVASSEGEIETRSGIIIKLDSSDNGITLTVYDGRTQRNGYAHIIPLKPSALEDLSQSLFVGIQKQEGGENIYQKFIPLPEKIDERFEIIGEIINQEINPSNHIYALLADYFHLSDSNKEDRVDELAVALEEASTSSQVQGALPQEEEAEEETQGSSSKILKKIRKTERKNQEKEDAERTIQQQQRRTEKLKSLKEKAKIKFPELIKFINACSKLNPETMEGMITQKGSHITLHNVGSPSKTVVKSHGKQKGNELSKSGKRQLFKDFG